MRPGLARIGIVSGHVLRAGGLVGAVFVGVVAIDPRPDVQLGAAVMAAGLLAVGAGGWWLLRASRRSWARRPRAARTAIPMRTAFPVLEHRPGIAGSRWATALFGAGFLAVGGGVTVAIVLTAPALSIRFVEIAGVVLFGGLGVLGVLVAALGPRRRPPDLDGPPTWPEWTSAALVMSCAVLLLVAGVLDAEDGAELIGGAAAVLLMGIGLLAGMIGRMRGRR